MADENTTDSTSTTTEATQEQSSESTQAEASTSTTDQTTDQSTEDAPAKTLLTDTPKDDEADSTADGTGEKDGEGEGEGTTDDETAELFGAPEGDYELELPEGVEVDTKALKAVEPVAKQLGLSNKGLSMIAGVYQEKVLPEVIETLNTELERNIAATHAQWAEQATELVKTDPVFEKQPLAKVQQIAAKAIDRFGGEELRKFYDETGSGNHPAMLKFAYLVGTAISEDTTFERGTTATKPKSREEKYYGPQT